MWGKRRSDTKLSDKQLQCFFSQAAASFNPKLVPCAGCQETSKTDMLAETAYA